MKDMTMRYMRSMSMDLNNKNFDEKIEELLDKPYAVIDFLPEQVKEEKGDNYFKVEQFFLEKKNKEGLYRHFAYFIIKLSSYYDLVINHNEKTISDYEMSDICDLFVNSGQKTCLNILLTEKECLISFIGNDLYLSVYNADDKLKELMKKLAMSEGLFLR